MNIIRNIYLLTPSTNTWLVYGIVKSQYNNESARLVQWSSSLLHVDRVKGIIWSGAVEVLETLQ